MCQDKCLLLQHKQILGLLELLSQCKAHGVNSQLFITKLPLLVLEYIFLLLPNREPLDILNYFYNVQISSDLQALNAHGWLHSCITTNHGLCTQKLSIASLLPGSFFHFFCTSLPVSDYPQVTAGSSAMYNEAPLGTVGGGGEDSLL